MRRLWPLILLLCWLPRQTPADDDLFPERVATDMAAAAFFSEVNQTGPEMAALAASVRNRTYYAAAIDLTLLFVRTTTLRPLLDRIVANDFAAFQENRERWVTAGTASRPPLPATAMGLLLDLAVLRDLAQSNRLTGPAALRLWCGVFQVVRGAEGGCLKDPVKAALIRLGAELTFFKRQVRWRKLSAKKRFVLPLPGSPEGMLIALLAPPRQP